MGLLLTPTAVGVGVAMTNAQAWARTMCALTFEPSPANAAGVLDLVVANFRVAAILLLAALALGSLRDPARRQARFAADLLVGLVMVLNVLPLGLALGGYGPARLLPWIPHWPLEAAALAVALNTYLGARWATVRLGVLLRATGLVVVLLAAGALVETFATPHA